MSAEVEAYCAGQPVPWVDRPRDVDGPFTERDAFDRKIPRQLHLGDYLLLIARASPGRVRPVPSRAIAEERLDDADEPVTLVACPCGHRPVVTTTVTRCHGCERYYVLIDSRTFVIYGAMEPPLQHAGGDRHANAREARAPRGDAIGAQ